ncbi:hypothetical protein JTB14_031738 [Gonioctena quinquepunctata]|nr:hypothetical protein JTB14_031738 [Gonioctena quinquepunctata]
MHFSRQQQNIASSARYNQPHGSYQQKNRLRFNVPVKVTLAAQQVDVDAFSQIRYRDCGKVVILCLTFLNVIDGARILGLFFVPSISHHNAYRPIWKKLSLRGHKVTVISPNTLSDPSLTNLTQIDIGFSYKTMEQSNLQENLAKENSALGNFLFGQEVASNLLQQQFEYSASLAFGLGARFKAPIVGLSSLQVYAYTHDYFGNPSHPVLRPDVIMAFADRVRSVIYSIGSRILYYWHILPEADRVARRYFGTDMPFLGDIIHNTSLLLINTNPIMHSPMPNVPSVVEIGQLHTGVKKGLPKDIKDYLDSSTNGVVYFSLGSNVKSVNLPEEQRRIIIQALSELPFNVIWKWEAEDMPGKPENVLIRKWLPQQDILGHPNIKVFVTQGGLQSIEEAIHEGVPMVGLPFFADQPVNVKVLVERGLALRLNVNTMTKEELKHAIIEVATSKRYRERVEESRIILLDQQTQGLDKAIWWIEYVIRHRGAKHLRSPAADISFFEYFMLDVAGFFLILLCLSIYSLRLFFRWMVPLKYDKVKTN